MAGSSRLKRFIRTRGALLADGIVGGGTVICPFHAYRFSLETGKPVGNDCEALQSYQVERSEDGPPTPSSPLLEQVTN